MRITRKEAQRRLNDKYANGEITQEEWSREFDELSSQRWTAEGQQTEKETKCTTNAKPM
jgi:hypothetical protein